MTDEEKKEETQEVEEKEISDTQEVQENQNTENSEEKKEEDIPTIQVDPETEFTLKLQEFDRDIATAEAQVADLKKQKMEYIYNSNVNLIVSRHQETLIKKQTEEEVKRKLASADGNNS